MAAPDQFHDLMVRVLAGDQDAATELARMFEPFIVRYVRFAMRGGATSTGSARASGPPMCASRFSKASSWGSRKAVLN